MHSGEPRQEVRSRQGSCVCVHCCTQARGGQRTSSCTPCPCRTGPHAARTRSSCPCHADHPRSAACPSSAWLALNGVSSTRRSAPVADATATAQVLWGCPSAGWAERRTEFLGQEPRGPRRWGSGAAQFARSVRAKLRRPGRLGPSPPPLALARISRIFFSNFGERSFHRKFHTHILTIVG